MGDVAIDGAGPAADASAVRDLRQVADGNGDGEAFFTLVGAMKDPDPIERASFAIDVFGKSGQGIINMAAKGGDEASPRWASRPSPWASP